jgi:hypothetical protein
MVYFFMLLISLGVFVIGFLGIVGFFVWAVPRYGAQAVAAAMRSSMPPMPPAPRRCAYLQCTRELGHIGPHTWGTSAK